MFREKVSKNRKDQTTRKHMCQFQENTIVALSNIRQPTERLQKK